MTKYVVVSYRHVKRPLRHIVPRQDQQRTLCGLSVFLKTWQTHEKFWDEPATCARCLGRTS